MKAVVELTWDAMWAYDMRLLLWALSLRLPVLRSVAVLDLSRMLGTCSMHDACACEQIYQSVLHCDL